MAIPFHYPDVDPHIVRAIDHKVRKLYGRFDLTAEDMDDLRQELFVHMLQQVHQYDPARAKWITFIDRVLRSGVANYLRARRARCRQNTLVSLDEVDDNSADPTLEYVTTLDGSFAGAALSHEVQDDGSATAVVDLRLDVEAVLVTLSPLLQRICRMLMEGESMLGVARALRIPRTSLYHQIEQLQRTFTEHGFEISFRLSRHF